MILPAVLHRNWHVVEPAALGSISVLGSGLSLLLAENATTSTQYTGIFISFLVWIGLGVFGIVGFTASYIAKAGVKAFADVSGEQAKKLYGLPEPKELDRRFADLSDQSNARTEKLLGILEELKDSVAESITSAKLLNQALNQQIKRVDEHHADITTLQAAVFSQRN